MPSHMAIAVAVAGAGDIVTEGLWHVLGAHPDLEVLREYPGACSSRGRRPDVVLYDAMAIQHDGGAELAALVETGESAVVVVGRELRPALATRAAALGAIGYVSLEAPLPCILSAIREAAAGQVSRPPVLGGEAGLTAREAAVLGDIVKGFSNQEIAQRQCLSINSIKSYIRSAYRKLDVTSRSQAVSWGLEHGFEHRDRDRDPAETARSRTQAGTSGLA
jgi:DNA-binding NarL/FixJ family response regulator